MNLVELFNSNVLTPSGFRDLAFHLPYAFTCFWVLLATLALIAMLRMPLSEADTGADRVPLAFVSGFVVTGVLIYTFWVTPGAFSQAMMSGLEGVPRVIDQTAATVSGRIVEGIMRGGIFPFMTMFPNWGVWSGTVPMPTWLAAALLTILVGTVMLIGYCAWKSRAMRSLLCGAVLALSAFAIILPALGAILFFAYAAIILFLFALMGKSIKS